MNWPIEQNCTSCKKYNHCRTVSVLPLGLVGCGHAWVPAYVEESPDGTQSKLESKVEATANISTGFIISWVMWSVLVGPLINAGYLVADSTLHAFIITSIFTISSWLRSYCWRRFFANNLHTVLRNQVRRYYENN